MISVPFSMSIFVMFAIVILVLIVAYKVFVKKKRPSNYYTPFDYITGQTDSEFHEAEIEVEKEKDNNGSDDKP